MRWRTENEVVAGKGQFVCGNKKCDSDGDLKSWEINFGYIEKEVKKNCLVKLRKIKPYANLIYFHVKRTQVKSQILKKFPYSTIEQEIVSQREATPRCRIQDLF